MLQLSTSLDPDPDHPNREDKSSPVPTQIPEVDVVLGTEPIRSLPMSCAPCAVVLRKFWR